jgi:hypothetical protein
VAEKHTLTAEQAKSLEFETTMVLLGSANRSNYRFNLESALDIDEDTAQKIDQEVTDTIFSEVWRSLDQMDKEGVETPEKINEKMDYDKKKMDEEEIAEPDTTETNNTATTIEPAKPVGAIALSSLSDRLKQASIAAPAKRDYTLDKKSVTGPLAGSEDASAESTPSEAPKGIDPYHESIDNE